MGLSDLFFAELSSTEHMLCAGHCSGAQGQAKKTSLVLLCSHIPCLIHHQADMVPPPKPAPNPPHISVPTATPDQGTDVSLV